MQLKPINESILLSDIYSYMIKVPFCFELFYPESKGDNLLQ